MSVDKEVFASGILSFSWYIDNETSRHVTMSNKNFIKFEIFKSSNEMSTANGEILPALGKGLLQIVTEANNKKQYKEFKDV